MASTETSGETTESTGTMPPVGAVDPNGCQTAPGGPGSDALSSHDMVEPSSGTTGDQISG